MHVTLREIHRQIKPKRLFWNIIKVASYNIELFISDVAISKMDRISLIMQCMVLVGSVFLSGEHNNSAGSISDAEGYRAMLLLLEE